MSRVAELIDLIAQGKNAEASDVLNSELLSRSYQAISDIKPQVAADYFAPVVDMTSSSASSACFLDNTDNLYCHGYGFNGQRGGGDVRGKNRRAGFREGLVRRTQTCLYQRPVILDSTFDQRTQKQAQNDYRTGCLHSGFCCGLPVLPTHGPHRRYLDQTPCLRRSGRRPLP